MTDQIALITGGSRGLGESIARHLARKGVGVIFTYRGGKAEADAVVADIAAMGGKAVTLHLDTAAPDSFAAFDRALAEALQRVWGRTDLDMLVNNAGYGINVALSDTTEAQLDDLFSVHVKGVLLLTQKIVPRMRDGGRIVLISTGLTRFTLPGFGAYAAMKGAVEVLGRYLALELGPRGIAVNTVAPGAIETDFGGGHVRDNPGCQRRHRGGHGHGRVGRPEDIGGGVASLLTGELEWMTGQRIELSGGQNL